MKTPAPDPDGTLAVDMAAAASPAELLQTVVTRLVRDHGFARAAVLMHEDEGLRLAAEAGGGPPFPPDLVERAALAGAVQAGPTPEGALALPVRVGSATAVLAVVPPPGASLTDAAVARLHVVAGQLAVALVFANQLAIAAADSLAFAAERERSEQLSLVNRLLREIAGALSRERVLEMATRRVQEAFAFPTVLMVVPDLVAGVNRIACARGEQVPPFDSYPLAAGNTGRVLRERRTVVMDDVMGDPESVPLLPGTRSEAMVPVVSGNDVLAILIVQAREQAACSRSQVLTLETLADGIAIALRNAELFQALERTNARLVELDRTKSELVNIVAHDFRAPLAGVVGNAELLEWKPDAPREERLEATRAILQATTQLTSMVQKTLQMTRLDSGRFPLAFGVMDLCAILGGVASALPPDPARPIRMELPEDPVACWADAARIAEVLQDLLDNARRYSPDGGAVRVTVSRDTDVATVAVADSGIGIHPRHHARLFRPFSRVREGRAVEHEGSGLGLYICDRIVRAHGGTLCLASEPGRGSTFTFTVPLFGLEAQTRPPLLLLATRDEASRREVRGLARELGHALHEAGDGVEVVEAAARLLPAAIITDRVLPRLGAVDIVERLRDAPATQDVPVFALAHSEELGEGARLFRACLPKPLDRSALAEALAAVTART